MGHADEFYTMKGYALNADGGLTSAMEDYLEMIARLTRQSEQVRVNGLSRTLHVKASSVTKMIQQLGQAGRAPEEAHAGEERHHVGGPHAARAHHGEVDEGHRRPALTADPDERGCHRRAAQRQHHR